MLIPKVSRRSFLAASTFAVLGSRMPLRAQAPRKPRVGCQLNAFSPKPGNFDAIVSDVRQAKAWGYDGFETNVRFVSDVFANPAPARAKLDAVGSTFIGMHTSMNEAAKGDLASWCDGGAALGAKYIVMSSSGLSPTGEFTAEALKEKCGQLEAFGKVCNARGMALAYHNHTQEFANHNAENQALADHTDPRLLHFLMDAGHGYQGGGDPAAFMRKNSSRIVGCHIKTFHNHSTQVPLGAPADFTFDDLAKAIRETGWAGWLECEEGGTPQGADLAAVVPDRAYIRQVFGV